MGIFRWRGRISRSDFRKQFADYLRVELPELDCVASPDNELDLLVTHHEGGEQATFALQRAYDEFATDPASRDSIFERWKPFIRRQCIRSPIQRGDVVPMLKSRAWIRDQVAGHAHSPIQDSPYAFWVDEYNDELAVVYAEHRDGFSYAVRSEFTAAGIEESGIRELALANLRDRTPERKFSPVSSAWMLSAGGNFEASLLLDDDLWTNHRFRDATEILATVPERDCLLASTDTSPIGVWSLAVMTAFGYRKEPYPISMQLMARRNGRFELLDPRVEEEAHPIPNVELLDVHGVKKDGGSTMVIVIASPLQADPRSIYRLHRKLGGYLEFMKTEAYRSRCGEGKTDIQIAIHRDSDPQVFELLEALPEYVERGGARLTVRHPD